MQFHRRSTLLVSSLLMIVAGCSEPKAIGPVAPPGFELPRNTSVIQSEPAQARGEQKVTKNDAQPKATPKQISMSPPTTVGSAVVKPSKLVYETLQVGTGDTAVPGKTVIVHYTGKLTDGAVFDSSRERNQPFSFILGGGNVISGWEEGVAGMKVGERRKLTIPPDLGYGAMGTPDRKIPGNSTLVFDIELMGIQ